MNPRPHSAPPTPRPAGQRGLHLVPAPPPLSRASGLDAPRHSPLALWHLLSLDAPSVAALWTAFLARCAHVALPRASVAAMFVAVWMLYAADRLLDARAAPAGEAGAELEERHRFHQRHRRAFMSCFLAASVLLAALLHRLPAASLHLYTLLAAPLAGYLLLIHAPALPPGVRLPKELAVGIFFPAAVFIPTVAHVPALRAWLLVPALLFAGLCTLNCLFVYAWEHPLDRRLAHPTTRWATAHLPLLSWTLAALSLAAATLLRHGVRTHDVAWAAAACGAGALLLLALHRAGDRFANVHLRALADAALLTPALLWPLALR